MNEWVGDLSTIPREHLRVIVGGWMEWVNDGTVRIFFERQRPQACEIHGGGSSSKHIYGGVLFVKD